MAWKVFTTLRCMPKWLNLPSIQPLWVVLNILALESQQIDNTNDFCKRVRFKGILYRKPIDSRDNYGGAVVLNLNKSRHAKIRYHWVCNLKLMYCLQEPGFKQSQLTNCFCMYKVWRYLKYIDHGILLSHQGV